MGILGSKKIKELLDSGKLNIDRGGNREIGINPASIDIHISDKFTSFKYSHRTFIDSKNLEDPVSNELLKPDGRHVVYHKYTDEYLGCQDYYIHKDDSLFATSEERIRLPDEICGNFYGSSSLLKMGVEIRSASSWSEFLEPGFKGDLRLFLRNNAWMPVKIYAGQVVGRLVLEEVKE